MDNYFINYSEPVRMFYEEKIIRNLWSYLAPTILILGTVGNILSYEILTHKSTRHLSAFSYLAFRSITDQIALLTSLGPMTLNGWLKRKVSNQIESQNLALCKSLNFIGNSSSYISGWLIVVLSCERVIIVNKPFHSLQYFGRRRACKVFAILVLFFTTICIHFLFTNKLFEDGTTKICITFNAWEYIDALLYSFIPSALIFISNIIIIVRINLTKRYDFNGLTNSTLNFSVFPCQQRPSTSLIKSFRPSMKEVRSRSTMLYGKSNVVNQKAARKRQWNENAIQITILLMIVSLTFVSTTAPIVIMKVLNNLSNLGDTISALIMSINHSINFYLLCITGSKFRYLLKLQLIHRIKTFRKCFTKCKRFTKTKKSQEKNEKRDPIGQQSLRRKYRSYPPSEIGFISVKIESEK